MNEICLSCRKHTKCGRAKHETIGCGYYAPLTELEYLQTCDAEQLVEAIYECVMANSWSFSKDGIKRWLKQPHNSPK